MQAPQQNNDKRSLTITLRGEQYKAERLNKTNYIALGSLVWEKGKPMPDLAQPHVQQQVAESMLMKFADPDFMKRLSYSLLSIFPSLANNNLVWFDVTGESTPPWGCDLEPEEILPIITAVSQALAGTQEGSAIASAHRERIAKMAALEAELAQLRDQG
jgi:hypothetical protein